MKRLMSAAIVVAIMMFGNLAFAQDMLVSVGLNSWYNSWESGWGSDTVKTEKSAMMVGPTIKIKKGKIFGGLTYLGAMSDYEFYWDNYGDYGDGTSGPYTSTYVFKRSDLDLMGGYMVTPRFGFYAGYKNSSADITGTSTHPLKLEEKETGTWSFSGPGVGITGNYPLSRASAIFYGSLSFMFLDYDFKVEGEKPTTRDMTGVSIELGVAGALSKNLSVNGGVKSQVFSGEDEEKNNYIESNHTEEEFLGLTAGISYMFGL